ncbi:leucine-rich repeat protein [Faecalibacterium prausnitzii]|uniref:leucine-rich repeat protein n=1 Tax=Faecalibacterium prausnitzii TaxID=853 RepID=UPI003D6FD316
MLPLSAVTAFAADIPALGEDEFDYQGLRYKKLSSSTVSVVGPVEVQTERVIPETVVNNGTTYTVTEIGDRAFDCRLVDSTPYKDYVGKPNFVSIKIPKTITRIGAYAFRQCGDMHTNSGLVNVIFDSESQLKLIDHDAFAGCYAIREFELPREVETIGENAFYDDWCIKKFTFQEGSRLKSIGGNAFHCNSSLQSLTLPSSVTNIGHHAFYQCSSLDEFVIPDGVESIERAVFAECSKLKTVTVPNSVKKIVQKAFLNCSSLETVVYKGTADQWDNLINSSNFEQTDNGNFKNPTALKYLCTVTFEMNGHGTAPVAQTIYTGDKLASVADPTAVGYTFGGWYTDKELTKAFDVENDTVSGDTTLYAKWKAIPDHELTVKVGTFTYDDNAASDKGNVYEGALVTVTFDENNQLWKDSGLSFDHWDIQSKAKLLDENGEEIVNPGKTFTFVMPKEGVTIEAMPKDATIEEEEEPNVLGTAAIIGTAAVGTAVLGYQAYSLGTEFAGKLMALPYFPSNRSALAMMLWEDAGKPMPESELLYPDVGQEERDMDLQHAARWAMENELIPDLNDEGTAPEEMKFFPANPVSKLDVLNAWQKAQELKNN